MDNNALSEDYYRNRFFEGKKVNLMVLPRMAVENCKLPDFIGKYLLISISQPNDVVPFDKENPNLIDYLRLGFFDFPKPMPGTRTFHEGDAKRAYQFCKHHMENGEVDTIVVHCHAGSARSSALACILSKIFNDEENWFWLHPYFRINVLVYKTTFDWYNRRVSPDKPLETKMI